jgi:DNA processing protein
MSKSAIVDWIALGLMPGLGSKTILQLIDRFGKPGAIFAACKKGGERCRGIKTKLLIPLSSPEPFLAQAKSLLQRLHSGGAIALCLEDPDYPSLLKEISDPPHVLYAQGNIELLNSFSVAMVGSRAATAYGKRAAFTLARDLVKAGATVVSGLAMGVDSEAHRGALSELGATIGVLGCGLDVTYPRQNANLYEEIRKKGLLLTEYPLGTRPDAFRFPARNRIIAGLSRGVVVVEAAKKSGSLITAEMALEEGREVFAVPGQIDSFKSSGAHWLLQQGAKLVQSADDILVECGSGLAAVSVEGVSHTALVSYSIDKDSADLLKKIDVYPSARNELIARSGLSSAKVAELLLMLELEGLIEMLPGDEVRKIHKKE